MSTATDQSQDSPPATYNNNIVEDIILWRKKVVSASIMAAATATWVLLQFYQFNFLTFASWASMSVVVSLFLWGNLTRLFGKEIQSLPEWKISERATLDTANKLRESLEEGVHRICKVSAQGQWYEFAGVVGTLLVLSWIGSRFDLLTILYISIITGLTAPVIYVKYEERIKVYWERMRVQGQRWCKTLDEKVLMRIKHKVGAVKEKKIQ